MDINLEDLDIDLERSASATSFPAYEAREAGLSPLADRSEAFLVPVDAGTRIISDDLQWIVQTRKGKASSKSSGWRSRHFCRSREGLQLALRRLLGRHGVPAEVVELISTLPEWHHLWKASTRRIENGP